MESSLNRLLLLWPVVLVFHFILATVGGMLIGFVPEAFASRRYYNTGLEPFTPMIALSAFLLGYFLSFRLLSPPPATWTWIIGFFGCWWEFRTRPAVGALHGQQRRRASRMFSRIYLEQPQSAATRSVSAN